MPRLFTFLLVMVHMACFAQEGSEKKQELAQINRELDNPLAKRWSLVFQENLSFNNGDLVPESTWGNTFFFQPALPIPFGKNKVFTARPVFPLVTQPNFANDLSGQERVTGFGDIQLAALVGPGNASGWVWGAGATFVFPTATEENLGNEKWQVGPTLMLFHLAKKWNKGIFLQHWWSVAGNEDRGEIALTDLQYVLRRNLGPSSIGMGPSIRIDWMADKGNRLTFPIGFGYTRTVLIGSLPVKMRLEPQYSIVKPDDYGTTWNIRLQIAPVIKSPFI